MVGWRSPTDAQLDRRSWITLDCVWDELARRRERLGKSADP
jgi:hypothetical protein